MIPRSDDLKRKPTHEKNFVVICRPFPGRYKNVIDCQNSKSPQYRLFCKMHKTNKRHGLDGRGERVRWTTGNLHATELPLSGQVPKPSRGARGLGFTSAQPEM